MSQLAAFVLKKFVSSILTLLGVSILIFVAIHSLPGTFAEVMAPQGTPELRKQIAEKFSLDRSYPFQFFSWIYSILKGDLGISLITQKPIIEEFKIRVPITTMIALTAAIIASIIAIPAGIIAGFYSQKNVVPQTIRTIGNLSVSVPDFVLASILLYLLSVYSFEYRLNSETFYAGSLSETFTSILIPATALSPMGIGLILATARNATIDIKNKGFVTSARARGETPLGIMMFHVLPNILVAVITVLAVYTGFLLGGAIIVEQLLSIQGFGRYLLQAVLNRDYPVVQSAVLISAAFFIFVNMLADILYALVDPRLRETQ